MANFNAGMLQGLVNTINEKDAVIKAQSDTIGNALAIIASKNKQINEFEEELSQLRRRNDVVEVATAAIARSQQMMTSLEEEVAQLKEQIRIFEDPNRYKCLDELTPENLLADYVDSKILEISGKVKNWNTKKEIKAVRAELEPTTDAFVTTVLKARTRGHSVRKFEESNIGAAGFHRNAS